MTKKFFIFSIIVSLFVGFGIAGEAKAGSEHNVYGFAWSERIGWISFNSTNCDSDGNGLTDQENYSQCPIGDSITNYGVNINSITTGEFSDYAWAGGGQNADGSPAKTIGWIRFDPPVSDGYPVTGPNYFACLDLPASISTSEPCNGIGDYTVSGWARACAVFPDGSCSGALRPDSERGGWDGWIKLRGFIDTDQDGIKDVGEEDYGVSLDSSVFPAQFRGWAWGGDDNDNEAVIGWISFNRSNCDPDQDGFSNGAAGCPPSGTVIANYKVMTDLVINPPPSANTLSSSEVAGCTAGSDPDILLSWIFDDPGDAQTAYRIEIDDDPAFGSPRGCPLNLAPYDVSTPGPGGPVYSCSPLDLAFSTTYYWRLQVWDNAGQSSGWINAPSSFTTGPRWPAPDFLCDGESCVGFSTRVDQEVTFNNQTDCFGLPCSYSWNFGDGSALDPSVSPSHIFSAIGIYNVTLTATSSAGTCDSIYPVNVSLRLPRPRWREIAPTF